MNSDRRPGGEALEDAEQELEQPALAGPVAQAATRTRRPPARDPGTSRASSGAAVPERRRRARRGPPDGRDRAAPRRPARTAAHPRRGRCSRRAGRRRPRPARARRSRRPAASCRRRPRPATRVALLRPSCAASSAARNRPSSADRPMRTGLETRTAMVSIIRSVTRIPHRQASWGSRPLRSPRRGHARQPADDGERPPGLPAPGRALFRPARAQEPTPLDLVEESLPPCLREDLHLVAVHLDLPFRGSLVPVLLQSLGLTDGSAITMSRYSGTAAAFVCQSAGSEHGRRERTAETSNLKRILESAAGSDARDIEDRGSGERSGFHALSFGRPRCSGYHSGLARARSGR